MIMLLIKDFSGIVEIPDKDGEFREGDKVFGFSLFGTYTTRLVVPSRQVRRLPVRRTTKANITLSEGKCGISDKIFLI